MEKPLSTLKTTALLCHKTYRACFLGAKRQQNLQDCSSRLSYPQSVIAIDRGLRYPLSLLWQQAAAIHVCLFRNQITQVTRIEFPKVIYPIAATCIYAQSEQIACRCQATSYPQPLLQWAIEAAEDPDLTIRLVSLAAVDIAMAIVFFASFTTTLTSKVSFMNV